MLKRLGPARPSPAMLVAVVALIVALGGTSVASDAVDLAKKKLITGKNIKKKSIQGDRLKDNTVTGTQVDESKLGKVPSATKADTATSATSATNATNATSATNSTQLGGHAAASFLRGTVTVIASAAVPANSFGGNTAICPTGYQAIGG